MYAYPHGMGSWKPTNSAGTLHSFVSTLRHVSSEVVSYCPQPRSYLSHILRNRSTVAIGSWSHQKYNLEESALVLRRLDRAVSFMIRIWILNKLTLMSKSKLYASYQSIRRTTNWPIESKVKKKEELWISTRIIWIFRYFNNNSHYKIQYGFSSCLTSVCIS